MKYEYMKEYETNGEKPDLPDDVLIKYKLRDGYESTSRIESIDFSVGGKLPNTNEVISFRIVDERYKPKPNDWHKRRELPPVGETVEARTQKEGAWCAWKNVEICGYHGDFVWFQCGSTYFHGLVHEMEFRPIRSERDKLIEDGKSLFDETQATKDSWEGIYHAIEALIDAGWRPIKQQSEDEFITHCSKINVVDGLNVADILQNALFELHRAGCRFIERGE